MRLHTLTAVAVILLLAGSARAGDTPQTANATTFGSPSLCRATPKSSPIEP